MSVRFKEKTLRKSVRETVGADLEFKFSTTVLETSTTLHSL